ncbi:MAG: hypothetical protein PHN51_11760 [Candidatus Nanopelagicales bacterium]|nr:hypothetical protein [Candidatus Nanopelagicales bacterium]
MAKGLFATESDDLNAEVGGDLESGAEVGAIAEVEADVSSDVVEMGETISDIEGGVAAGDQLAEVEDVLTSAVDSGEGLSEVAAESVRLALRAICAPIGANPKTVYAMYAKESFQSDSSRLANSQFALEGVKEFSKDLYKKLKAALERLWTKAKAFWDKHISNLGRVKKATEAMKKKAKASSGKLKAGPFVESIPASLAKGFIASGQLDYSNVKKVIDAHLTFAGSVANGLEASGQLIGVLTAQIKQLTSSDAVPEFDKTGEETVIEAKGLYGDRDLKVTMDISNDDDSVTVDFNIEYEDGDADADGSKGMTIPTKDRLVELLTGIDRVMKETVDFRKKYDKSVQETGKALQAMSDAVQKVDEKHTAALRKHVGFIYKCSTFDTKLMNLFLAENIKLARGVMSYASFALKQYK